MMFLCWNRVRYCWRNVGSVAVLPSRFINTCLRQKHCEPGRRHTGVRTVHNYCGSFNPFIWCACRHVNIGASYKTLLLINIEWATLLLFSDTRACVYACKTLPTKERAVSFIMCFPSTNKIASLAHFCSKRLCGLCNFLQLELTKLSYIFLHCRCKMGTHVFLEKD